VISATKSQLYMHYKQKPSFLCITTM